MAMSRDNNFPVGYSPTTYIKCYSVWAHLTLNKEAFLLCRLTNVMTPEMLKRERDEYMDVLPGAAVVKFTKFDEKAKQKFWKATCITITNMYPGVWTSPLMQPCDYIIVIR